MRLLRLSERAVCHHGVLVPHPYRAGTAGRLQFAAVQPNAAAVGVGYPGIDGFDVVELPGVDRRVGADEHHVLDLAFTRLGQGHGRGAVRQGAHLDRPEPVDPWVAETDGKGVRLYGSELAPPENARTVRVRDSRAIVTDGPFAETKEQIAGFDVLECADLDEAIEVARRHPMARLGVLEVRPFWPFEED